MESRPRKISGYIVDATIVAVSIGLALLLFVWTYNPDANPTTPDGCRRIAAVYVGARLVALEMAHALPVPESTQIMDALRARLVPDADVRVPRSIVPDLNDYDLDVGFLAVSAKYDPSTIVIAAKGRDEKAKARLVVLADGTIKAVASDEPLAGKKIVNITARIYDVTPEKGIIVQ